MAWIIVGCGEHGTKENIWTQESDIKVGKRD